MVEVFIVYAVTWTGEREVKVMVIPSNTGTDTTSARRVSCVSYPGGVSGVTLRRGEGLRDGPRK